MPTSPEERGDCHETEEQEDASQDEKVLELSALIRSDADLDRIDESALVHEACV